MYRKFTTSFLTIQPTELTQRAPRRIEILDKM